MRNWSIVTKIVVSACGIVCVLMILGGFVLLNFEIQMVTSFTREISRGINQFIDKRAEEETADLKNKIQLNAEILSGIGSTYLYNLDQDGMRQSLRPYLDYKEVVAIKVLDERGAPFAAAWRDPDVNTGDSLPADLALDKYPSIFVECVREGKQIGSFTVYYTDSIIKKKIQELKKRSTRETGSLSGCLPFPVGQGDLEPGGRGVFYLAGAGCVPDHFSAGAGSQAPQGRFIRGQPTGQF